MCVCVGGSGQQDLPGAEGLIAVAEHKCVSLWDLRVGGTHFTCVTSTKVQLVTQKALPGGAPRAACVQRLIPYSVYLVYWYKSTNIDAIGAARGGAARRVCATADSNGKLSAIFCQLGQV